MNRPEEGRRKGAEVGGLDVESSPRYIEAELVRGDGDERLPAANFTLLPVEEAGPFSARVELGAPTNQGTAHMVVKCCGIRSR